MRQIGLLALALLAIAAPAQAQVIIEEAPGSQGASMEPTSYLNVETSRILPGSLQYLSLAGGYDSGLSVLDLQYNRGLGFGGELQAAIASLWTPYVTPSGEGPAGVPPHLDVGLGYKQRVAVIGPWDAALHGFVSDTLTAHSFLDFVVEVPFTAELGPGDLTLAPQLALPDLTNGGNGASGALKAGYRLPLGTNWRILGEAVAGATFGSMPQFAGKLGVRYMPLPVLAIDASVHLGTPGFDAQPQFPENNAPISLAVRFGF